MKRPRRAGFSLLEVILATAILLGSAVVLAELAAVGREHATSAEDLATAQLICQSKLSEILAGAAPAAGVQDQPLVEAPGWVYSVEIDPIEESGQPQGVASLRVTVRQVLDDAGTAGGSRRRREFTLARWIRHPGTASATDFEPTEPAEDAIDLLLDGREFP